MSAILKDLIAQPILAALALGVVAYVFAKVWPLVGRVAALAAGAWVIVAALRMLWGGLGEMPQRFAPVLSIPLGPVSLDVAFAATHLGQLVIIASAAFAILITLYSVRYMAGARGEGRFYAYLIWALAGACLVGGAANFFVLLLGWELVTVMLYLMFNLGEHAEKGAAKSFAILGFADTCLLLAVALMFVVKSVPGQALHNLSLFPDDLPVCAADLGWIGYAIYGLLLVAALAKAGAIPLHSWIPTAAEHAPLPAFAYLPAALDKLLGIYLLARVSLNVFQPDPIMGNILMWVGVVTIVAAGFMAVVQSNFKKMLAFSAVSQVGYIVLGIGTGNPIGIVGGLFHMVNHAIYKSNLFLMSGAVGRAAGTDEIDQMGGLARVLPWTFGCGAIAAAAGAGVPPLNGFVSKWLIYQGALGLNSSVGIVFLVAAVFGSALTLATFVKAMYSAFLGRPTKVVTEEKSRESFWMVLPMAVLAAACVVLGVMPGLVINNVISPAVPGAGAVSAFGGQMSTIQQGVWSPTAALGFIMIGLALGLMLLAIFSLKNIRIVRPFLSGEIAAGDDRFRTPGTGFYAALQRVRILGGLLRSGESGAFDLYRWCGRYGQTLANLLSDQHTGLLPLYVAWCIVGLAITVSYLFIAGQGMP
jgi:formate hydrogenlyase subunit 3/multisubunit Na+/H+ antiporter MnhD subunit